MTEVQTKVNPQSTAARTTKVHSQEILGTDAGRVDLIVEDFTRAIEEHGYEVMWEQAMPCPCQKIGTDGYSAQPSLDCERCDNGFIYVQPQVIRTLINEVTTHQDYTKPQGFIITGDMVMTTRSIHPLDYQDRVTLLHSSVRFSELIQRGEGTCDVLRYPIIDVVAVVSEAAEFEAGQDFRVIENELDWSEAVNQPDAGENISVAYLFRPILKVIDTPHKFRGVQVAFNRPTPEYEPMPVEAIARWDFLWDRESAEHGRLS